MCLFLVWGGMLRVSYLIIIWLLWDVFVYIFLLLLLCCASLLPSVSPNSAD